MSHLLAGAARALLFHALATLVPRPVRANQAKRGGLEKSATLEWRMTSQTKLPRATEKGDREWGCVSAADQGEGVLL